MLETIRGILEAVRKMGPVGALALIAMVLVYHLVWGSDASPQTLDLLRRHVYQQKATMYVAKQSCYFLAQLVRGNPAQCDPPPVLNGGNGQ